jgi:hypothetical protein
VVKRTHAMLKQSKRTWKGRLRREETCMISKL